ncbi:MAG: flagellar export protein FliJ [Dehalococcoidia bacterium]
MTTYRFRFAPLLDYAEQREDEQAGVLAAASRAEAAAFETLQMLVTERERQIGLLETGGGLLSPDGRQLAIAYIEHLAAQAVAQQQTVVALHEQTEVQRAALMDLAREKQSLEHLRDRDASIAAEAEGRREARQLDDLNMSRHIRRAGGRGSA